MQKDFIKEALQAVKSQLTGLPSFSRLVIYELMSSCDFELGTISISTLDELAHNDFHIIPAPGRKKEAINGDTLRNALRTIKKAKPHDFKFTIKNQRIVIEMPFLRDLYQKFLKEESQVAAVDASELNILNPLSGAEELAPLSLLNLTEDVAHVAAATSADEVINNKTNKHNKQTGEEVLESEIKIISSNFYPTPETIAIALGRGFFKVTNHEEIQKFIKYNQANESKWVDFNPVFLCWLERDSEYQQIKQQQKSRTQNIIRSSNNERSPHKNNSYAAAMEAVLNDNRNACAPSGLYPSQGLESDSSTYCLAVDSANEHLRATIHQ